MTQGYSIQWDPSLPPFAGPDAELPEVGYAIEAMADGTNFGNPEALIEVVKSLLTDGSLAVLEGWDNRQAPIRLRLSAPTAIAGPALAEAEKALMLAVQARSKAPLVYVPPAQDAATCVFDVVAAKLERDTDDGWDIDEVRREYRYYLLTLTCLPFARTEESVSVEALPPAPPVETSVVIDTCDSLTNWSVGNDPDQTLTTSSGYVQVVRATGPSDSVRVHRTGAVTMTGTPYLAVDISVVPGTLPLNPALFTYVGSTPSSASKVATSIVDATTTRHFFGPITGSFDAVRIIAYIQPANPYLTPGQGARVHQVMRTDTLPAGGTTREQARLAEVVGSAPTQAAIRLYDETPAALGSDILIHSSRNTAWQPPLRVWLASSAAVDADGTMVSGARNTLATPSTFRIPAFALTEGNYALLARMSVATAGTLTWQARMVSAAGAATVGSAQVVTGSISLAVTTGYQVVTLGSVVLPVVAVEGDQMVELVLTGTADMTLDEAWLFGLDDGALTWLRDADSLTWIEVRSPELGANRPSVYGGTGVQGANSICIDWKCQSFGAHRFEPGLMQVFTLTSASLVSQSELEFYPRYHSHVDGSSA